MVRARLRFVSPLAVTLLAALVLPLCNLSAKNLGDYQLGDKVEEDIVATTKLNFVDHLGGDASRAGKGGSVNGCR